jgi:hypothetical protein
VIFARSFVNSKGTHALQINTCAATLALCCFRSKPRAALNRLDIGCLAAALGHRSHYLPTLPILCQEGFETPMFFNTIGPKADVCRLA